LISPSERNKSSSGNWERRRKRKPIPIGIVSLLGISS